MRTTTLLARRPGFTIRAVTCWDDHVGWSSPEPRTGFGFVLARRGRFGWQSRGQVVDVDPTVGYVTVPGAEERFAHPAGGDVCTSVEVGPELWRGGAPADPALYVDARLELAHRRLLKAVQAQDVDYGVVEELLGLLVIAGKSAVPAGSRDRMLLAAAREAIQAADPGGLLPLAELLDVSPYRLSRAFTRELGISLTQYRNRVRVGRALDRLEAGEQDLAGLAADLGFADQAHLCRTIRVHVGRTPTAVARIFKT
ncbi:AraC-like DNA-binding protein [Kibdelosporangium banguiense]|uniref:AraC-like DNA-binding protein n=1 Tax=Kibdelosporangium banguiense TaxID=1365924 RepID=A0ABS4TMS5_9PSEU|nr:AraC family transcriptional regulator [Kibdelosporangium banguiense]MBP2325712.1 AraC-like DNA-binding protein [Kibdelosporangium banguiense]